MYILYAFSVRWDSKNTFSLDILSVSKTKNS